MSKRMGRAGLKLLKKFEGWRSKAYRDAVGVWTIGYGHTSMAGAPKVKPGMVISRAEGERILRNDLKKYENAVKRYIKVPLTQNQFDALTSFCYNVGPGAFRRSSVAKEANRGNHKAVPSRLMRWNKAGGRVLRGLTRRRREEGKLYAKAPARVVAKELASSRTIAAQASTAAGSAGLTVENTSLGQSLQDVGNEVSMISYISEWLGIISAALLIGGIALTLYARYDDAKYNSKAVDDSMVD